MKALSLWQPWASLVAEGIKTIETRNWSTRYRGPLAIAATRSTGRILRSRYALDPDEPGWTDETGRHGVLSSQAAALADAVISCGYWPMCGENGNPGKGLDRLPFGAVVATCRLVECVRTERIQWEPERFEVKGRLVEWSRGGMAADRFDARIAEEQRPFGDYMSGRWAWLLADVVKLDPPIPARGRQGLWEWNASEGGRPALPNAILGG